MSPKSLHAASRSAVSKVLDHLTLRSGSRREIGGSGVATPAESSKAQTALLPQSDTTADAERGVHVPLAQSLSRRTAMKLAGFPVVTGLVGIEAAQRIDVTSTTQAGANALVRSNGTIDLRAKLNNLIEGLGAAGGVLYFPPSQKNPDTDYYALTSGPIYLKDNVALEGSVGYERETVLRNNAPDSASFFTKATVRFGGTQNSLHLNRESSANLYRTIQDTEENQDFIRCRNESDANVCQVGDQIVLVSPQYYLDNNNKETLQKALWMMHNYIVEKNGRQLKLLWPIPFSLRSKQRNFPSYSPTGAPVFFRAAEVVGPPPYNRAGQMIVPRNVGIRNMTLACDNGNVMQTQLPLASELENLVIYAPTRKALYGNAGQMSLYRNIVCRCGQGIAEIAMNSFANRFENIKCERTRNYTEGGGIASILWSWQEGAWGNTVDGLSMPRQRYIWSPKGNANVFRDTGYDNVMMNIDIVLHADAGTIFYNVPQNSSVFNDGWRLRGRVIKGAKITYVSDSGPKDIVNPEDIIGHNYQGVKINNPSGMPRITLSSGSNNNVFRDWDVENANIMVREGAKRNEFTRVRQKNGTFVDRGEGTITTRRTEQPELGRYNI